MANIISFLINWYFGRMAQADKSTSLKPAYPAFVACPD
jgi:hypothetical protein